MQKNGRIFSYSIYKSLVDNGLNRFMSGIVGFLFRQVDFDSESLSTLSDLSGKGRIVFASFQNNNTSLLILTSLLKTQARYSFSGDRVQKLFHSDSCIIHKQDY